MKGCGEGGGGATVPDEPLVVATGNGMPYARCEQQVVMTTEDTYNGRRSPERLFLP